MSRKIYLPWSDPFLGRMWMPEKTNAFYDFTRDHGGKVLDLAGAVRTRTLTNGLTNGNFAGGTTGWAGDYATIAASGGILSATGNGTSIYAGAQQATAAIPYASGKVVYVKGKLRVTNAVVAHAWIWVSASGMATQSVLIKSGPAENTWYDFGVILTAAAGGSGNIMFRILVQYADAATANGKVTQLQEVIAYDLTAASAVDTAANITQLLQDNNIVYHDGSQTMRYGNYLTNSGATDYGHSRYFDQSDDYGALMNSPAIDITALPLSLFTTLKIPSGASSGYIFCKNLAAANDAQYALYYNATNPHLDVYLNGSVVASSANNSVIADKWQDHGFIANGATVQTHINALANGSPANFSDALVSKPYARIMRRETATGYGKGWMDNLCIYTTGDKQAILDHRRWLMLRKGLLA